MSDSATPWTVTYQAPPYRGFSRREYWSGLPFPSPITCCVASLQRGVAQIKEEFVSIQTCRKVNGESSGQWVTSICHSPLGCKLRGLISYMMGRGLQVEQLLIIYLAWRYGIFHSLCREPALLCNRACCSSGVAKETSLSACSFHKSWSPEDKNVFEYV